MKLMRQPIKPDIGKNLIVPLNGPNEFHLLA